GAHVFETTDLQPACCHVQLADAGCVLTAHVHPAQAVPADHRQDKRNCQHQAEAESKFEIDADIAEPCVHRKNPRSLKERTRGAFFLVLPLSQFLLLYRPSCALLEFDRGLELGPGVQTTGLPFRLENTMRLPHLPGFSTSTRVYAQTSSPIRLLRLPSPPSWAKMPDFSAPFDSEQPPQEISDAQPS